MNLDSRQRAMLQEMGIATPWLSLLPGDFALGAAHGGRWAAHPPAARVGTVDTGIGPATQAHARRAVRGGDENVTGVARAVDDGSRDRAGQPGLDAWSDVAPDAAPSAKPREGQATATAGHAAHQPGQRPARVTDAAALSPTLHAAVPAGFSAISAAVSDGESAGAVPSLAAISATAAIPERTADLTADVPQAWHLAPPVNLYAPLAAKSVLAPVAVSGAGAGAWLLLLETPTPHAPLQGDAGQLLHHMLRALRLHQRPDIWLCPVQRPGSAPLAALHAPQAPGLDWQPLAPALHSAIAQVRPVRILIFGLAAARAVLQCSDPQPSLGQLRAQPHTVHGTPAIVSHDLAYLLRAPHAKPAAWADWCRAAWAG